MKKVDFLEMDFQQLILKANNKKNMMHIAERAMANESELLQLIHFAESHQSNYSYPSSWALSLISNIEKELLLSFVENILQIINTCHHQGIKRNLMKVLQNMDIPKNLVFEIGETCLGFLKNHQSTIAVKVYAVSTLEHLLHQETCFHEEVMFELEKQMIHATPAFNARAKRYLKTAKKYGQF